MFWQNQRNVSCFNSDVTWLMSWFRHDENLFCDEKRHSFVKGLNPSPSKLVFSVFTWIMRSVVIQTKRHFHENQACYVSFKNKANKESFEDDISFKTIFIWVKTQITFFPLHHVWILLFSSGTKPWNLFSDLLKLFYHSIHKLSL